MAKGERTSETTRDTGKNIRQKEKEREKEWRQKYEKEKKERDKEKIEGHCDAWFPSPPLYRNQSL